MTKSTVGKPTTVYFKGIIKGIKHPDEDNQQKVVMHEIQLTHDSQPTDHWRAAKCFGSQLEPLVKEYPDGTPPVIELDDTSDPEAPPEDSKVVSIRRFMEGDRVQIVAQDMGHVVHGPVMVGKGSKQKPRLTHDGRPIWKTTYHLNRRSEIYHR